MTDKEDNSDFSGSTYFEKFTMVIRKTQQDLSLSPQAYQLLGYMLSLPPGWTHRTAYFQKMFKVDITTIRRWFKELIEKDYIVRRRKISATGKYEGFKYKVMPVSDWQKYPELVEEVKRMTESVDKSKKPEGKNALLDEKPSNPLKTKGLHNKKPGGKFASLDKCPLYIDNIDKKEDIKNIDNIDREDPVDNSPKESSSPQGQPLSKSFSDSKKTLKDYCDWDNPRSLVSEVLAYDINFETNKQGGMQFSRHFISQTVMKLGLQKNRTVHNDRAFVNLMVALLLKEKHPYENRNSETFRFKDVVNHFEKKENNV